MKKSLRPSRRSTAAAASAAGTLFLVGGAAALITRPAIARQQPPASVAAADPNTLMPPLSLLWKYTGAPQGSDAVAPVISGDMVIFGARGSASGAGALFAVDAKNGERKWRFDLTGVNLFLTPPTVENGNIFIGASDGNVYQIDAKSGHEVVRYRTGRAVASQPVISNDTLYFGSNDGTFYALDPQTGNPVWKQLYKPGDSINSSPLIADGNIFMTTNDNSVHGIKQATGIFRWKQRMPYRVPANSIVYSEGALYVPSGPRLYALQPTSGNIRWGRELPSDILVAPVISDNIIYTIVRNERGAGAKVYAIRAVNRKDAWAQPAQLPAAPVAAPTISGNVMYVPTAQNVLVALSLEDGEILWQYHMDPSTSQPNTLPATKTALTAPVTISKGSLFVLSDDGSLSAFRPDAPDTSGPVVTRTYPTSGGLANGTAPFTVAAYLSDPGSGLDPESVKLKLDDKEVAATYDPDRSLVLYATKSSGKIIDRPLPDGRHSASLSVADWRGNVTEQTWSFVIDSRVPAPASRETPVAAPTPPRTGRGGVGRTGTGTGNGNGGTGTGNGNGNGGNGGRRGGRRGNRGGNGGGNGNGGL